MATYLLSAFFEFKNITMGGQCQRPVSLSFSPDLKNSQIIHHPVFGQVIRIRGQPSGQAFKRISYHSIDASEFRKRFQLTKESNQAVATLVQVYDCNMIGQHNQNADNTHIDSSLNCKGEDPHILLSFQYFEPQDSLISILHSRCASLQKIRRRLGANIIQNADLVRLCNYQQIDRLPSQQRQVVNNYFQQIEILRMIDHIVGALYFLHHFDIAHMAVRLQTLLVDHEGKYLLADRQLFALATNYTLALQQVKDQQMKQESCFQFIAPEWLPQLNQLKEQSKEDNQKADIFCVGLLAMKMCLLKWSKHIYSYDTQSKKFVFHDYILMELLTHVKARYSQQFFRLLVQMLKKDPQQRVDFSQLIDQLNPVLLKNLQNIKELHSPPCTHDKPMIQSQMVPTAPQRNILKQQLEKMEESFQKVMNKRTLLLQSEANHQTIKQEEQNLLKRLKLLQSTKSKTGRSQKQQENHPVSIFQLGQSTHQNHSPNSGKRYLNGQQLQRIMWREYENLRNGQGVS